MGMTALRKAVKKAASTKDTFAVGSVIRWVSEAPNDAGYTSSEDGVRRYTYAAIKTPVGWFTTSREYNRFIPQVLLWKDLLEVLTRDETVDVEVAATWTSVSEG